MELYHGFDSNYRYILVAARRARQLQNGASPLIETTATKPCRIAAQELEADKVKWETKPVESKELPDPQSGTETGAA